LGSTVEGNTITKIVLRPHKRGRAGDVEERYPRDEKKETKKSHSARDCVSAAETPSRALWDFFSKRLRPLRPGAASAFPLPGLVGGSATDKSFKL